MTMNGRTISTQFWHLGGTEKEGCLHTPRMYLQISAMTRTVFSSLFYTGELHTMCIVIY